jgi:hypothetical protein
MPETLRDRIRSAADTQAPTPDLTRVTGRARALRIRRTIAGAVVVAVACAAVAVPLVSLRHLGGGRTSHRPAPAGPVFGDGSVSFRDAEGWTHLQGGTLSACATTAAFVDEDVQQSQDVGPNDVLGCRASAAALPPDGVLVTASASDPYRWEQPSVNFPASSLPPTLDPATCGAVTYGGQPHGTAECRVWVTANDRHLGISVWFGTETPGDELRTRAQAGLDALAVSHPASLGNDIAFEPTRGWHDQAVGPARDGALFPRPTAWTSNVELAPVDGSFQPAGPSNDEIAKLPPEGVILSVQQSIVTRNPLPDTADYQPLPDRPIISDGRLLTGGWEGLAVEAVSQLYLRGVLNGRPVIVQAFFRTQAPGPDLIERAQIGLNRLVVVPLPPPTTELDDFGISMGLPDGWHGWLFAGEPTLVATTSDPQNPFSAPNVAQQMGPTDIAILLEEGAALQDLRWPAIAGAPQIGPEHLCVGCEMLDGGQPPAPGHARYHHTFTSGGRAFDLYVEFGSTPTEQQLADVNRTLRTLQLAPAPDPQPAPPGGTAVGSLYDGAKPSVLPDDADRTLSWSYGDGTSLSVPAGWTGWTYLVTDTSDPINLYALGSWEVPQGGYCAPLMALQQLPSAGALIWIDRYGARSAADVQPDPWPSSPQVGPGTEPTPASTSCTAGAPVQSFAWELLGRTYAVHVAFGPDVTDENIQAARRALSSFAAEV